MRVKYKRKVILLIIILFIIFSIVISYCESKENTQSGLIHLEVGTSYDNFLNISNESSHHYWIYLEYNRTYTIIVDPSWKSKDADLSFYFNGTDNQINFVDEKSKGSTEKYEYRTMSEGVYYITVFSDISADYTIIIKEDEPLSTETWLVILFIALINF